MKNQWFKYLDEQIFENIDTVINLVMLDNKIQGTSNDINDIIGSINDFSYDDFDSVFLANVVIEGDSVSLVHFFGNAIGKSFNLNILKNNLALNKWIVKKYDDFCLLNCIPINYKVTIGDCFDFGEESVFLIGSSAFCDELESMINADVNKIII